MKVFITGANGFVGKHVFSRLIKDDSLRLFVPTSKQLNVLDESALFSYCEETRPDAVIHLAALCGGIGINQDRPADFLYVNLMMGINVANVCKEYNCKLINVGTVCSYPKFASIPFKEEDFWNGYPEETNAPYGIAKKTVMEYTKALKLNVTNLVPVNMCGEYDNFDLYSSHVIPALIRKLEEAQDANKTHIEVWGNGEASREFLYAGDFANAIYTALYKNTDAEPINIGTGSEIKIKDLVDKIIKIGNYNVRPVWLTDKPNGQPRRCLDITKANNILKWEPTTSLDTAISRTITYWRNNS